MPTPLLPTTPAPMSYKITSKVNTLQSESLSGKILTRKVGGQRFEATLVFPPMNKGNFNAIHSFLMEQGSGGIFYIQIPTFGDTFGAAGEYVNYSNHTKTYMIPSTGTGTYPELIVAAGTVVPAVTYMRVSLRNSVQTIEYGADGVVRLEIDTVERL